MSAPATNDLWAQLRSLGYDLTPAQIEPTRALMAPLAPLAGPDVEVHRDAAYGSDPRHRLDVLSRPPVLRALPSSCLFTAADSSGAIKGRPTRRFTTMWDCGRPDPAASASR